LKLAAAKRGEDAVVALRRRSSTAPLKLILAPLAVAQQTVSPSTIIDGPIEARNRARVLRWPRGLSVDDHRRPH